MYSHKKTKTALSGLVSTTSLLAICSTGALYAAPAMAQTAFDDEIIVTATRRAQSIQDIPFNIAAIGGEQIAEQGFDDISELIAFVPGVNIVDQGGRDGNRIVVRGLNADPISGGGGGANSGGGGTVSTYVGEIPVYVDLRLNDLERVEVLLGPQGTLYGAGTMGGAIRYIPTKPQFGEVSGEARAEAFSYKEGDGISSDIGFTGNFSFNDMFAIRASVDYLDDQGFIDYPFVSRQPGFFTPDPDFTNQADVDANLQRFDDTNTEEVLSGRVALRFQPTDWFDSTLTYYYQKAENGGRTTSGLRGPIPAGEYEAPLRVLEPAKLVSELLSLEATVDLGFAELTSATGISEESFLGQRDQTDLLISLEYSYESFPNFTGLTREQERNTFINQEVRLVSKNDGPLNWIVGGYYNKNKFDGLSEEFTPEYGNFAFGSAGRIPDLEYYAFGKSELVEKAAFGELGYQITDKWNVTVGVRGYAYELDTADSVTLPLSSDTITTVFFPYFGCDASQGCGLSFEDATDFFDVAANQSFSGELFKVNTSYKFENGNSVYATFSQGFRNGVSNGLAPCADIFVPGPQGQCGLVPGQQFGPNPGDIAQVNEREATPDTVDNYEIGAKTTWLDGALRLNAALYYIDWSGIQISSASVNANLPITVNGGSAVSKGVELDGRWAVSDNLSFRGNYSYTDSELTQNVPALVRTIVPGGGFSSAFEDGQDGDRLPGSPKHQFSVFGDYSHPLANGDDIVFNTGYSWQGKILSRVGGRGSSFTLPSYGRLNASLGYEADSWNIAVFADNILNDYSESSVVGTSLSNQAVGPNNLTVRSFRTNVLPPRVIGARMRYKFGG